MADKYLKYILKLPKNIQIKILQTVKKIKTLDFENLDIKEMKGASNVFRCRSGKLRIVFQKISDTDIKIIDINSRGDIYK